MSVFAAEKADASATEVLERATLAMRVEICDRLLLEQGPFQSRIALKGDPPLSFFKKLFGSDEKESQTTEASARAARTPAPPRDSPIVESMTKVSELEVRLIKYFQQHPEPENKSLTDLAFELSANNSALLFLLQLPKSEFGEAQIGTLLAKLEGTGQIKGLEETIAPDLKECLKSITRASAAEREQLRQRFGSKLVTLLNMYYDLGRKFLLKREMKDQGCSAAEIDKAFKADAPNVF